MRHFDMIFKVVCDLLPTDIIKACNVRSSQVVCVGRATITTWVVAGSSGSVRHLVQEIVEEALQTDLLYFSQTAFVRGLLYYKVFGLTVVSDRRWSSV